MLLENKCLFLYNFSAISTNVPATAAYYSAAAAQLPTNLAAPAVAAMT